MSQSDELYTPPTGPPQGPPPDPAIFKALGVEGITLMLEDFYLQLGASPIAGLFPQGESALREAGRKSALFFVGVCGGPPLYAQQHGPPRMRARHMPFAIDAEAREQWLACWEPVLAAAPEKYGFPPEHLPDFRRFLEGFSAWMVNRA
jgi:hemoglobin